MHSALQNRLASALLQLTVVRLREGKVCICRCFHLCGWVFSVLQTHLWESEMKFMAKGPVLALQGGCCGPSEFKGRVDPVSHPRSEDGTRVRGSLLKHRERIPLTGPQQPSAGVPTCRAPSSRCWASCRESAVEPLCLKRRCHLKSGLHRSALHPNADGPQCGTSQGRPQTSPNRPWLCPVPRTSS